jgi:hypothetical protein
MAKAWKQKERDLTRWLSRGRFLDAIRISRHELGSKVADILWGLFSIELKTRKEKIPNYLKSWMHQATRNTGGGIPVVVWHEDYAQMGTQYVVLRLSDFWNLVVTLVLTVWQVLARDGNEPTPTLVEEYMEAMYYQAKQEARKEYDWKDVELDIDDRGRPGSDSESGTKEIHIYRPGDDGP